MILTVRIKELQLGLEEHTAIPILSAGRNFMKHLRPRLQSKGLSLNIKHAKQQTK